uniref:Uncharacterized protein n=1 Tax=Anguilla anguilla TaxID=7936 RepID=A0A0E9WGW7_ANGAN
MKGVPREHTTSQRCCDVQRCRSITAMRMFAFSGMEISNVI